MSKQQLFLFLYISVVFLFVCLYFGSYFRKFFFDLDDKSEEGIDALTMAEHMDQSEASLNNLLELEDKDDELLLQLEENKAIQQGTKLYYHHLSISAYV